MIEYNLPALSIQQPWAMSVAKGWKPVENRSWKTNYRGAFLIHAGKKYDQQGREFIRERFPDLKFPVEDPCHQLGGIVGMAEIIDCVTESDNPWFFGPFGFVIKNARPLPFMPCAGKLGFFKVEYRT